MIMGKTNKKIPPFGHGVQFMRVNSHCEKMLVFGVSHGDTNGNEDDLWISYGGYAVSTTAWRSLLDEDLKGSGWNEEWEKWGTGDEEDVL